MPTRKARPKNTPTAVELGMVEDESTRSPAGQFLPGHQWRADGVVVSAHKHAVTGRKQALEVLDEVLGEVKTREELRSFFRRAITNEPWRFCEKILVPLMPKQALLELDDESTGEVTIQIISAVPRPNRGDIEVEGKLLAYSRQQVAETPPVVDPPAGV